MLIRENVSLKDFSNYKIGGPARFFAEPKTIDEIKEVLRAREKDAPLFILGGGTNLLINDNGFPGLVLRPRLTHIVKEGEILRVGAGALVKDLLDEAISQGLAGLEWAGGLPGEVGGAIRGNAGCFGGEIKDVIVEVTSISTETGEVRTCSGSECRFSYRNSKFKEEGTDIILEAKLSLKPGEKAALRAIADDHIRYRAERHPMNYPNIGSVFKNVDVRKAPQALVEEERIKKIIKTDPFPVIPTAFLLSEAGLKGKRAGGAMISDKHPNFIVNVDGAKAADVRELIALMKQTILEKFGVVLEEEIQYV